MGAEAFEVMGLRLQNIHRAAIAERVVEAVEEKSGLLVVNANAHCVTLSQKESWMRGFFAQADIAFCDGAGVQLATKILKGFTPHRTTPPEWIGAALERLGPKARVFWLGGAPDVALAAAAAFEARYDVVTVGVQHGYFDPTPGSDESQAIVARINESQPTVLLVNMGMPRQERWLWDHSRELRPLVAITAGALVDHAAGRVSRPPRWVANLGIEWLVRLLREPRRLWRRYLLGLPVFGIYLVSYAIRAGIPRRGRAESKTSA
ncbi:MAG: WecB/TagA/CpsF family glycosyltransferase [Proteobacteria bacterium]|nr:WecB/TagA/CpsF family glycosyltransferase [Pseudomonadota bacterium]